MPTLTHQRNVKRLSKFRRDERENMITGLLLDDGTVTLEGSPVNKTWVRSNPTSREETAAWGIIPYTDIPVEVDRNRAGDRVIVGADWPKGTVVLGTALSGVVQPALNGAVTGALLHARNLSMGLVRPWAEGGYGLSVFVDPLPYGDTVITGSLNVSASVPGNSGEKRLVVIAWDVSDGALVAVNGTPTTSLAAFTLEDVAAIPLGDSDRIRLGAVVLNYGQTSITPSTLLIDARDWLTPQGVLTEDDLGWTLTHDVTLSAGHDFTVVGPINLNGYTLTVNGSLWLL